MTSSAETILRQAMQLPAGDRAALVDELIGSLDRVDPSLDALRLREAEARVAAYRAGNLEAMEADQVFVELGRKA